MKSEYIANSFLLDFYFMSHLYQSSFVLLALIYSCKINSIAQHCLETTSQRLAPNNFLYITKHISYVRLGGRVCPSVSHSVSELLLWGRSTSATSSDNALLDTTPSSVSSAAALEISSCSLTGAGVESTFLINVASAN